MTLTSFPFIAYYYYAASHKVATPISTQRTNFRPKRVENGFTKSKPGPSPLFPAIKTTQKTSSRRRRLCNGKVGRKSCLSSFFLLSFFFSAPFFYSNVSKLVLRTYKLSIEFFSSVLFCGCLILPSRRSRLRKGVDYCWLFSTWSAKFCAVGECCSNDELGLIQR